MAKSSISKPATRGPDLEFATALGHAIRARRQAIGLTQTELGFPLTKGFVSEVERGRTVPSLRSLVLIAERLGVRIDELLRDLAGQDGAMLTAADQ